MANIDLKMTVREFLDHIGVDTYEIEQDGEPEISAYSKQYRRKAIPSLMLCKLQRTSISQN